MYSEKEVLETFTRELSQQTGWGEAVLQWNEQWKEGEEVEGAENCKKPEPKWRKLGGNSVVARGSLESSQGKTFLSKDE